MRCAVVDEQCRPRQGKRPRDHLKCQNDGQRGPSHVSSIWEKSQEGYGEVCQHGEWEENSITGQGPQSGIHPRVYQDLKRETDDSNNGCCESDLLARKSEAASEQKREMRILVVRARSREEEKDEGVEGTNVHGEQMVLKKRQDHIPLEDFSNWDRNF